MEVAETSRGDEEHVAEAEREVADRPDGMEVAEPIRQGDEEYLAEAEREVVDRFLTPLLEQRPACPRRALLESLACALGEEVDKDEFDRLFCTETFIHGISDPRLIPFAGPHAWRSVLGAMTKINNNLLCKQVR